MNWPDYFKLLLLAAILTVTYYCVDEVTTLRDRVRKLERRPAATAASPDINLTITIPDDWVK